MPKRLDIVRIQKGTSGSRLGKCRYKDFRLPILENMGWLSKIFKGSVNRVSRGHYNGNTHEGHSAWHTKAYEHDSDHEDIDRAIALSLSEEDQRKGKAVDEVDIDHRLHEDEQLARALQESLNDEPPRQNVPVKDVHSESTPATFMPPYIFPSTGLRVCAGCKTPIGQGRFLSCMDSVWHPQCFRCFACDRPISEYEFAVHEGNPYHRSCYKELFHPKCDVCKNFIPTNKDGHIEYRAHPFWMQKYCPAHETDRTPRCCSCERMEPKDSKYITLDDGRKLCLECLNTSIMDTDECQPLYIDIQEFYEGLNMKVEQQIPLLLVERQALNEAMEAEKTGHHLAETRGLCLSEEQIVRTILRRPVIGPGNKIVDMITGPYKLVRRCEVTAILILYGLPRLLTGSILAHEMMHAYLRLKGYQTLDPKVEEGICQVLAHMWLESEITSGSSSIIASIAASSSSSSSSSAPSSKKGVQTDFEKKLGEFFKHQIETDPSDVYGDGFRDGIKAVERYGLRKTLDHMKLTGVFPC
ncbi:protein DA1-related 1 isoform X2 [Oryza sativa Japonica Group]|uniref:protein DA1-related 1 isoform X2 n=1 Tax=Oryza sativa subsp. japonica TaxID=39947 RepID=UPI000E1B5667|nr:protein DA1-related 1 isoform X2 [Oryza sativa Japonica Group]